MICVEARRRLDACVDDELEPRETEALRAHVRSCAACERLLAERESLGRLIRSLPYYRAPPLLRARIARAIGRRRLQSRLLMLAAGIAFAVSVYGSTEVARFARTRQAAAITAAVADEVVRDHVRALKEGRIFEVRSSDQHTVKPWFLGKVDFSPPVEDLSPIGFPLVGGRLDSVAGQTVATLVYQRRLHPIDVFVSPSADRTAAADSRSIRGFQVRHWIRNGMSFWAVSDLSDPELAEFVRALQP